MNIFVRVRSKHVLLGMIDLIWYSPCCASIMDWSSNLATGQLWPFSRLVIINVELEWILEAIHLPLSESFTFARSSDFSQSRSYDFLMVFQCCSKNFPMEPFTYPGESVNGLPAMSTFNCHIRPSENCALNLCVCVCEEFVIFIHVTPFLPAPTKYRIRPMSIRISPFE